MSLIGRIVTKILGNDDPNYRPDERNQDSSNLVGRIVTKLLRR
jgi:hypothetical protein